MKSTVWLIGAVLLFAITGCKKGIALPETPQEQPAKFPPPNWKADDTGIYPASMTAVVALPQALSATMGKNDQLAAFINDECRGEGVMVKVNNANVYFVLIRGMSDEQSKITFKYYNAGTSYLYKTVAEADFFIDYVYGTAQNPMVLNVTQVK